MTIQQHDTQSLIKPNNIDHLLALASLFQDDFSMDWIVELTLCKASIVLGALEELTKAGWLKRKQPGFYCFSTEKKGFSQSLSDEKQTDFHRRISEIIIADTIDDISKAKALYYHLKQISNDLNGYRQLKKAGDLFLRHYDINRALKCYLKIIDGLPRIGGEAADMLFIETTLRYARISLAQQKNSKVLSILKTALAIATRLNKPAYQALIKVNMATSEWFLARDDKAIRCFEEGLKIAEKLDDRSALDKIHLFNAFFYFRQGLHREVIEWYEKFVPEVTKFPKGMFPLINVTIAGYSYGQTGQFAQGMGVLDALRQHTKQIGDQYMEAYAVGTIGNLWLDIGKNEEALKNLEYGMELSARSNNHYEEIGCSIYLAYCYYLMNNNTQAIAYLKKYIDLCSQFQFELLPQQPYLMMLCWGIEEGMFPAVAGLSLEKEIRKLLSTRNVFLKGIAYRYQALLERKQGADHEKIITSLNLSIEALNQSGSIIGVAKTQLEMARQHLLSGSDESAKQMVNSASQPLFPLNEALIPDDLKPLCGFEEQKRELLLKGILKLGQNIVNIRESRELVLQIISSANRLTGAERGALFLKNSKGLMLKASKNITSDEISHASFSKSMRVVKEVARTGIGLIEGMNRKDKDANLEGKTICSVICVPMMFRDELKGVLYQDNRLLGSAFKESDLDLLAYFAALATIALGNVTSYEEIQEAKQKLAEKKKYFEEQYLGEMSTVNIVGASPPLKRVLKQIKQVAQTDAGVLILGDTGVGKELVACAIHHNSLRKDKPFVCVQCSSLPETLLPSELLGHERGAFTGAIKRKLGRFKLADGGTVFLDEMGELSMNIQVQLLRILETKKFERIGGTVTLQSDFRLIAATNRNLKKEVEAGRFRQDLYYRLNVFPIHVPSLKERKEDVPLLVSYFSELFSKKLRKTFDRISLEDITKLVDYDWPGNVRELQNLVERAVIIHHGSTLRFSGLLPSPSQVPPKENTEENIMSLSGIERKYIIQALQKTNWKVSGTRGAANLLNINSSTLAFRMKKLGIKRPA